MNEMLKEASLEIFQSIIEQNPDPIFVFSVDGIVLEVNQMVTMLFGYSQDEILGIHYRDLIVPEQAEQCDHLFNQSVGGIPFEAEIKIFHKNGGILCPTIKGIPLSSKGNTIGIFCVVKDMSESFKMKKDSLEESERLYRLLADNSFDLIQLVNLDGIITYASPSYSTVLGYDPEEYVGNWVFYQPNGELDESFKGIFLNMALTHTSFSCEVVRKHHCGYEVWIEMTGKPMFDEKGEFKHMMLVGHEITERKEHEKHLEFLSYHDPLTHIPNRRLFKERLEQAIMDANLANRTFAVMYMDIDHFKQINDTLGHDAGNELLIQFANRVKMQLRKGDTLARQGGDEFTILLPEIQKKEEAFRVAEGIQDCLKGNWKIGTHVLHMTSSIGISFYPMDGTTADKLIKHADQALYDAKGNGRSCYKTYSCF